MKNKIMLNQTAEEIMKPTDKIKEAFEYVNYILENKEKELENLRAERKKYIEEWTDLTANEYQEAALRTANRKLNWKESLTDGLMGLNGEAGECIDILKKHLYQGHELNREALVEELGDVTWYIALIAKALGVTMDDVMRTNLIKLQKRYPDGFSADRSVNREEYGNKPKFIFDEELTKMEDLVSKPLITPDKLDRIKFDKGMFEARNNTVSANEALTNIQNELSKTNPADMATMALKATDKD